MRWEGRALPSAALGTGEDRQLGWAGVWGPQEEVCGGGPPAAGSSIPPARRQGLQQKAPLVAGQEPGAFLKTTSPVKSLLFLIRGCRSQSCQGWRLEGSREVAESWQCLSELALAPAPALQAGPPACPGFGQYRGSPWHPVQTPGGEAPVPRQGEHPRLHPTCTPRDAGCGGGQGAAGCRPCLPPGWLCH